jgi:hypothetical protein
MHRMFVEKVILISMLFFVYFNLAFHCSIPHKLEFLLLLKCISCFSVDPFMWVLLENRNKHFSHIFWIEPKQ